MPSEPSEAGTKTVRIAGEAATKLQTVKALKEQMGERFSPVEYLNGLVEGPIDELYEQVTQAFADFQAKHKKAPRKKPG